MRQLVSVRVATFTAVAACVIALGVGGWLLLAAPAEGKIADHIFVGDLALGGLSLDDAQLQLQQRADALLDNPWKFHADGQTATLSPTAEATADPDIAYALASIDVPATIQQAYAIGRQWRLPWQRDTIVVPAIVALNTDRLASAVRQTFPTFERTGAPSHLAREGSDNHLMLTVPVEPRTIDDAKLAVDVQKALTALKAPDITVEQEVLHVGLNPNEISAEQLREVDQSLKRNLPLVLKADGREWILNEKEILPYLSFQYDGESGFNPTVLETIFEGPLKPMVDDLFHQATTPRFKLENGRVTVWQGPQEGRQVKIPETLALITDAVYGSEKKSVTVALQITPGQPIEGEGKELGLTSLLGVGRSNFAGSPKNRRHNIKVGADTLNGVLIAPGEDFSLIKTLGAIDASSGYLQELVIKGNSTIPEYGGGLCQIGTTVFRTALASGLPITERRNHSYRVRYYEPAGTDATIYDPKPDFRFLNDTGHHILIQTEIKGDELEFSFWGTDDGRIAEQTTPRIFNIVSPPPQKNIETLDLKPGEKKCTESAHAGADAEFKYTVTYASGEKKEQVFSSHYRPWQAVCLIGVEKLSTPPEGETPPADGTTPPPTDPAAPPASADTPAVVTP